MFDRRKLNSDLDTIFENQAKIDRVIRKTFQEYPHSLWNGHTVCTEKCQCTLKSIPPIKCLIDNLLWTGNLPIKFLISGS